jgi:flagellar protein FlaG
MENNSIDPVANAPNASQEVRRQKAPQGTLVIESKVDEITRGTDADKLRSKTQESRVEASKNLEMIRERLKEISDSINEDLSTRSKDLKFSVDEITNRMLVTVSEKESGKIIKQIPSETILKVSHSLEALKGLLYDDKY